LDRDQLIRYLLTAGNASAARELAGMSTADLRRRYVRRKALTLKRLNDRARFALEEAVVV